MTEFIFMWLDKLGYGHPLHPPVTHVPMGLVIGGCLFTLVAHFWNKPPLFRTSLHCYVLALIGIFPTIFVGYMDWQHFYQGVWHPYIIAKIIMAFALLAICIVNISLLRKESPKSIRLLISCILSLALAGTLGFFGGELIYGQ